MQKQIKYVLVPLIGIFFSGILNSMELTVQSNLDQKLNITGLPVEVIMIFLDQEMIDYINNYDSIFYLSLKNFEKYIKNEVDEIWNSSKISKVCRRLREISQQYYSNNLEERLRRLRLERFNYLTNNIKSKINEFKWQPTFNQEEVDKQLINALNKRNLKRAIEFVSMGANVNSISTSLDPWRKGQTILMLAIMNKHEDIIALLLKLEVDINIKDHKGLNALFHVAIRGCKKETVDLLLNKGADSNCVVNGNNVLMESSLRGRENIVKALLVKGVDVNAKNNKGITALMRAAGGASEDVVKLLLSNGAEINVQDQYGDTALIKAVNDFDSSKDVVELLLSNGADVNIIDSKF